MQIFYFTKPDMVSAPQRSFTNGIQQSEYIDMMWLDFHVVVWVGVQ